MSDRSEGRPNGAPKINPTATEIGFESFFLDAEVVFLTPRCLHDIFAISRRICERIYHSPRRCNFNPIQELI